MSVANLIKVDTGSENLGAIHVEKNVFGSFLMEVFLEDREITIRLEEIYGKQDK